MMIMCLNCVFYISFLACIGMAEESCSITADTNCKYVDPYSLWASWSHASAYRTKRLSAWKCISVHPSICSIIRPPMSICRFSKAETSQWISGYILEAEPSQRYIIPVGHQPMTSHLVPAEPSLDASTKRSEAAAAATAATAPEVRQMERPEAREAPKQGSGPSPPREKSHSSPGLLGWPLGIGEGFSVFGLLQFVVFTSMSPCQWSCCSGCL